eukprot:1190862-Prorocentrum_minimum.AAC.3
MGDSQDRDILREWQQTRDALAFDTSDVFSRFLEGSERPLDEGWRQSTSESSARLALLSEEADLLVSIGCTKSSDRCVSTFCSGAPLIFHPIFEALCCHIPTFQQCRHCTAVSHMSVVAPIRNTLRTHESNLTRPFNRCTTPLPGPGTASYGW